MSELYKAMEEAITSINDLTTLSINDYDMTLTECFPSKDFRTITIDGKTYRMKISIELTEM